MALDFTSPTKENYGTGERAAKKIAVEPVKKACVSPKSSQNKFSAVMPKESEIRAKPLVRPVSVAKLTNY